MSNFFMIIIPIYVNYVIMYWFFRRQEWSLTTDRRNYSELKEHNTLVNRLLIFMLNEYKYLPKRRKDRYNPHRRREKNYYYYSKKYISI